MVREHVAMVSVVCFLMAAGTAAQDGIAGGTIVPRQIPIAGTLVDGSGQPLVGPQPVTFAIYTDQEGGAPLWAEVQTVVPDERGRFSAWLGAAGEGLPVETFQTGEARWLGVQVAGQAEQPRVRLLSVPYAIKAADAETLGGLPVSAFLRSDASGAGVSPSSTARRIGFVPLNADLRADTDTTPPTAAEGYAGGATTYLTYIGQGALAANTTGAENTAVGYQALNLNTTTSWNTAIGYRALAANTSGFSNTAVGNDALKANTGGLWNSAFGVSTLGGNTTGSANSAFGLAALTNNTNASNNAAFGHHALLLNTTGGSNSAFGREALVLNTTGSRNVAVGYQAGSNATTGNDNVYIANQGVAGEIGAIYIGTEGTHTMTALAGNVGIGTTKPAQKLHVAGTASTYVNVASSAGNAGLVLRSSASSAHLWSKSADGAFVVENPLGTPRMVVTADGKLGVGTTAPAQAFELLGGGSQYVNLWSTAGNAGFVLTAGGYQGIVRENVADGSLAIENPNGTERLRVASNGYVGIGTAAPAYPLQMGSGAHVTAGGVWTNASSRALKDQIATLSPEAALEALLALEPVTYVYKADPGDPQVGFIAEDVPALVATNDRTSLAPMDIVAVAVKVIQAQQVRLEAQQAVSAAQSAELAAVRQELSELRQLLLAARQR